jgi:hypothetical protein
MLTHENDVTTFREIRRQPLCDKYPKSSLLGSELLIYRYESNLAGKFSLPRR